MNLWASAAGLLEVDLVSADPGGILTEITAGGVRLSHVCYLDPFTVRVRMSRGDFRFVRAMGEKRGAAVRLVRRLGLYWPVKALLGRPILLLGLCVLLFLILFLPTRVLFVQVSGNEQIPRRQILEAAEASGIRFFVSRRQVRSERVKNALLGELPQLQWAGVNTRGCVAVISVKERELPGVQENPYPVSGVVASRDGIIDSCVASAGNLLCSPGQAVKKGQILISGYTDCGTHLKATRAEGEVYALTKQEIQVVSPLESLSRKEPESEKRRYSLIVGKKRINLWKDSGICPTTCGRMYKEYYITLPGGFSLPFALAVETVTGWKTVTSEDSEEVLSGVARTYLLQQMVAGRILEETEEAWVENGVRWLTGSYVCREMIGRVQREQIGENYVQNN